MQRTSCEGPRAGHQALWRLQLNEWMEFGRAEMGPSGWEVQSEPRHWQEIMSVFGEHQGS